MRPSLRPLQSFALTVCVLAACSAPDEDPSTAAADPSPPATDTVAATTTGAADPTTGPDPTTTDTPDPTDPPTTDPPPTTDTPDPTGAPGTCGDGVVDEWESCDDGPANADDGACTSVCRYASCGDGLVHAGHEECDDGNPFNTDFCLVGCLLPACGDGFHGPGEVCDDGNDVDDDDCPNSCTAGGCGDGFVQVGEQCDDANGIFNDACIACKLAVCGDGYLQDGVEGCDDGNDIDDDTCTNDCISPGCGDGVENGFETDLDCGGVYCDGCKLGQHCAGNLDCGEGICSGGVCGQPLPLDPPDCAPEQVSVQQAYGAIQGACNCHGNGAGSLAFNGASSFRDNTVGVAAQTAAMALVTPNDVENSYLIFKVLDQQDHVAGGRGSRMPVAKSLSPNQICALINWIDSGAD